MWAPNKLRDIEVKGIFDEAISRAPRVWERHCEVVNSTTNEETYVMLNALPKPRAYIDERQFQDLLDFSFTIRNDESELSFTIKRNWLEDDQTGLIRRRLADIAEAWAHYDDERFKDLLVNGATSTYNGWDGATFFQSSRTGNMYGGTIDNTIDVTAATEGYPTAAEYLTGINAARERFMGFTDARGRPMNSGAIASMRLIIPSGHFRGALEAANATATPDANVNAGVPNVLRGSFAVDEFPYLTSNLKSYLTLNPMGRRAFVKQVRMPLEIITYGEEKEITENRGLKILCRERSTMTYLEPARAIELGSFT